MNCLMLEDDPDFSIIMRHAMKGERSLTCVETYAESASAMKRIPMDLILVDLRLPDSSDAETISRLSELKARSPHAKLVVLTGNPHPEVRERAYGAGADLVLQKEVDFRKTVAAIMQLYRSPDKPVACLDAETVAQIEDTVKAVVARARNVPSVPRETVNRVVELLAGPSPSFCPFVGTCPMVH